MSENAVVTFFVAFVVIVCLAHVFGFILEKLHQPRLIGEILAGIAVGPFVLGVIYPSLASDFFAIAEGNTTPQSTLFGLLYWIGVLLLMFLSGSRVRGLFAKGSRKQVAWLLSVGTPLPFLLVICFGLLVPESIQMIAGEKNVSFSALLVLASAVAVTSIPVLSRIFHDLKIIQTRFASLILGAAVIEDIALWAVFAVAMSYASVSSTEGVTPLLMLTHIGLNIAYLVLALTIVPRLLEQLRRTRYNVLYRFLPITYCMAILGVYVAVASVMQVNIIFAAFLAGLGLVGGIKSAQYSHYSTSLERIKRIAFAVFIPVYFAIVGYRLVFDGTFSLYMLALFLVGSSLLAIVCVGLAARLAGFKRLDIINIAITTNARGGPGIVLASAAYEATIINSSFYTTLVISALVTSSLAGMWLQYVLKKGWPLLSQPQKRRRA